MRKIGRQIYKMFFPKSIYAVLYRLGYYVLPISICFYVYEVSIIHLALLYLYIEGFVCPTRNLINDLHDYRDDQLRGYKWDRCVSEQNKRFIAIFVTAKLIAIIVSSTIINFHLLACMCILIITQFLYDILKKKYYMGALTIIALGYGLRTLPFYYVFNIEVSFPIVLVELIIIFYAFFQLLDWRHSEAKFLQKHNLKQKPGDNYFLLPHIKVYALTVFIIFCILLDIFFAISIEIALYKYCVIFFIQAAIIILYLINLKLRNAIHFLSTTSIFASLLISAYTFTILVLFAPIIVLKNSFNNNDGNEYFNKK